MKKGSHKMIASSIVHSQHPVESSRYAWDSGNIADFDASNSNQNKVFRFSHQTSEAANLVADRQQFREPLRNIQLQQTGDNYETYSKHLDQFNSSSRVLTIVIKGGPKWGFCIKQLNDGRVIVSRLDKGPAERSGLKVYDELLSVNNVALGDNGPRSLLLHDYAAASMANVAASVASAAVAAATGTPIERGATGASSQLNKQQSSTNAPNGSVCEPLEPADAAYLAATAAAAASQQPGAPVALPPGAKATGTSGMLELSKLDFAYQLIKHSSGSNKLILTVKRFASAAYARASVAASNGSIRLTDQQQQQQSTISYRTGASSLAKSTAIALARPLESLGLFQSMTGAPPEKRAHITSGHSNNYSSYNCCECYRVQDDEGE